MKAQKHKKYFDYSRKELKIFANVIEDSCRSVGCDLRCFDWMSYNPDFYRNQEKKKAA